MNPSEPNMVDVRLSRIVFREGQDRQYIYLTERAGRRGFPIVIGTNEALEIDRVVKGFQSERPLTHQLVHSVIEALAAELKRCDITDLRNGTFYAQLVLQNKSGSTTVVVDARPSDAIALALRARCGIRVAESVLEEVRTDEGVDPLPGPEETSE
jgi:bifunctional DNase/RNase